MSAEQMNPFFIDEELAVETLGSNFDRLANSMDGYRVRFSRKARLSVFVSWVAELELLECG